MAKKDLNKMTLQELDQEVSKAKEKIKSVSKEPIKGTAFLIGSNYLIRTVTMIYTGKLINVNEKELVLTECAWIPETKRWAETTANGVFEEVEPYPEEAEVIINREALLDAFIVSWKLPRKQQ